MIDHSDDNLPVRAPTFNGGPMRSTSSGGSSPRRCRCRRLSFTSSCASSAISILAAGCRKPGPGHPATTQCRGRRDECSGSFPHADIDYAANEEMTNKRGAVSKCFGAAQNVFNRALRIDARAGRHCGPSTPPAVLQQTAKRWTEVDRRLPLPPKTPVAPLTAGGLFNHGFARL